MNKECKFKVGDRVKVSKEAYQYAKDPSQLQRWKRDRGNVLNSKFTCITRSDGSKYHDWIIKVDFSDSYLKVISYTSEFLELADD